MMSLSHKSGSCIHCYPSKKMPQGLHILLAPITAEMRTEVENTSQDFASHCPLLRELRDLCKDGEHTNRFDEIVIARIRAKKNHPSLKLVELSISSLFMERIAGLLRLFSMWVRSWRSLPRDVLSCGPPVAADTRIVMTGRPTTWAASDNFQE